MELTNVPAPSFIQTQKIIIMKKGSTQLTFDVGGDCTLHRPIF